MIRAMRNPKRTYSGCPVLSDNDIARYLATGELSGNPTYLEVPPGKVIRQRGFWLKPGARMHHTATLFLVSTDVYAMNEDDHAELRKQIYCYRSPKSNTAYLGSIEKVTADQRALVPLMPGLHEPLLIEGSDLVYVGRVIASI